MDDIISMTTLVDSAKRALIYCLDFIAENTVFSPWTQKKAGWQEQWFQSKFTGLYATCNALPLLFYDEERYKKVINNAIEELFYLFDNSIIYKDSENDTEEEKKRKARCRLLLEQNSHTTLKAVYYLRAFEFLKSLSALSENLERISEISESVYKQVESVFCKETGIFSPAIENTIDNSILTTSQAFMVMKDRWGIFSPNVIITKQLLLNHIKTYSSFIQNDNHITKNKFEKYRIKSDFTASLYALSHSIDCVTSEEKSVIADAFYSSMQDREIREGFFIKDSYTVPNTVLSRDVYTVDSRMLYLKSVIQLIANQIISPATIECFIDDIVEIIDTSLSKKQYLYWDSAPSFSHNIRGLSVLQDFINVFDEINIEHTIYNISPLMQGFDYQVITPLDVVLFMSFAKEYSESVQETVFEVLHYIGFNIWWASNDPYDVFVVDRIQYKLAHAQFVLIDCNERSANVMYEAGLSHGFGKHTLLCGCSADVFPYEDDTPFETCVFDSNGEVNPPPYRDLQKGIIQFVLNNIDTFSLPEAKKEVIINRSKQFLHIYCE